MNLADAIQKVKKPRKKAAILYLTQEVSTMLDELSTEFDTSRSTVVGAIILASHHEQFGKIE